MQSVCRSPFTRYILLHGFCVPTDSETEKDAWCQFARARDDLNTLIGYVGSFVDWWGDMNMRLTNLEEILSTVRVDDKSVFRTETVTERWIGVHQKYVWYQRKVQHSYYIRFR
jgi:hypothetical protein